MTQVADSVLGKIARQQNDLFRRLREGSLNPAIVSAQLQDAIQGNFTVGQVPVWMVVRQRRTMSAFYIDRDIKAKTSYSLPEDLSIGVGSDSYDVTLVKLRSSDLKAKGANAIVICDIAQNNFGLQLCQPDLALHLCLQYDLKKGECFIMPFYGFSSTSTDPGQCALFQYKPEGNNGRHKVFGVKPLECGVGLDPEWVFQLNRKWVV
jgi:hypothetical protein